MFQYLSEITDVLWGTPLTILMIGVGLYLSIRTKFFQFTGFRTTYRLTVNEIFGRNKKTDDDHAKHSGTLKPFQALSTVLAGTIGSGNIAGVAAAIAVGGPGAVFWMWIIAFVGMITKMAEVTLALAFRKKGTDGEFYGGPMHYMRKGLSKGGKTLAAIYSVALLIYVITDACFIQVHTLAETTQRVFRVPLLIAGAVTVLVAIVIVVGGTKRIGEFCGKMVPPMCVLYIVGAIAVIIANASEISHAFQMIFKYAFAPTPAVGGFLGATTSLAIGQGAARGIFSNEAGIGTASTVHATSKTDHPAHQGMYGILEVFIDTIIVCTLTALAILTSGVWTGGESGVNLTISAFETAWGDQGIIVLGIAIILFTFSSYLGFFVEYRTCIETIFGEKAVKYLQWFFFVPPMLAVTMQVEEVWTMADMAIGFIVIPNMIAIVMLSNKFIAYFKEYKQILAGKTMKRMPWGE